MDRPGRGSEAAATGLCPLPFASHALVSSAILACANDEQKSLAAACGQWQEVACTRLYDDANWIDPGAITATATANENGYI